MRTKGLDLQAKVLHRHRMHQILLAIKTFADTQAQLKAVDRIMYDDEVLAMEPSIRERYLAQLLVDGIAHGNWPWC